MQAASPHGGSLSARSYGLITFSIIGPEALEPEPALPLAVPLETLEPAAQYYYWQYHWKHCQYQTASTARTISSPYEDSLLTMRIILDAEEEEEENVKDDVGYGDTGVKHATGKVP